MPDFSDIVFVTDLDGTLLPSNKIPLQKDLEAIKRFKKYGGTFTIATGRVIQAADQFFDILKPNAPVILNNGSLIHDIKTGKTLYNRTLDRSAKEYTLALMEKFPEMGVEVNFSDKICVVRLTEWEQQHLNVTHLPYVETGIDDIPEDGWCKVLYSVSHDMIHELEEFAASEGWDKASFVVSGESYFECLPKDTAKGFALKELIKIAGWENCRIAASGDYNNDLELLENADIPIAPQNAQEIVKKAAEFVTSADCNSGFISEAIEYIEKCYIK